MGSGVGTSGKVAIRYAYSTDISSWLINWGDVGPKRGGWCAD